MPSGIYTRTKPSGMKGKHQTLEARLKISKNNCRYWLGKKIIVSEEARRNMCGRTGEKSFCWIKDRTKIKTDRLKSYDVQYKYWMLAVKKRDNWKCRIGNKNCRGRLEAHHILSWRDNPDLRYNINNGITLCLAHHPRRKTDEERLIPTFVEIITKTNAGL